MTFANLDNAVEWLRENNIQYFSAHTSDGQNKKLFESVDDLPFEENLDKFKKVMSYSPFGRIIIKGSTAKKQTTGLFYFEFSNLQNNQNSALISGVPQIQGVSEDEVDRRIKYALIERDNADLKLEVEFLSKENERADIAKAKVWERVNEYMPLISAAVSGLVQKYTGTPAPPIAIAGIENFDAKVNGTHAAAAAEGSDTDSRLLSALEKWEQADPQYYQFIETFAEFAHSGKKFMGMTYQQVKKMFSPQKLKGMLS
ncbi:MAG: hypothetical protein LBS01_04960 [Prevotellaceae bacterium]|jgi:hypothetical protein|nr:hypothetical protein [Prevotellaceae bacterium]